jgi:hypothetical protein
MVTLSLYASAYMSMWDLLFVLYELVCYPTLSLSLFLCPSIYPTLSQAHSSSLSVDLTHNTLSVLFMTHILSVCLPRSLPLSVDLKRKTALSLSGVNSGDRTQESWFDSPTPSLPLSPLTNSCSVGLPDSIHLPDPPSPSPSALALSLSLFLRQSDSSFSFFLCILYLTLFLCYSQVYQLLCFP